MFDFVELAAADDFEVCLVEIVVDAADAAQEGEAPFARNSSDMSFCATCRAISSSFCRPNRRALSSYLSTDGLLWLESKFAKLRRFSNFPLSSSIEGEKNAEKLSSSPSSPLLLPEPKKLALGGFG